MNYSFKNINVSTITQTSGATQNQNDYDNFPTISTNYTGLLPLPLSYVLSTGDDISSICTAQSVLCTSTQNVNVPTGANYVRVISVGGGGGGGGAGGPATMNVTAEGGQTCSYPNGGPGGGSGGAGGISYYEIGLSGSNTISVTVGSGGNGGSQGNSTSQNFNAQNGLSVNGGSGNSGNTGNSSYITISNSNYAMSNGGNGGNGGEGSQVNGNLSAANFSMEYYCSGSPSAGNSGNSGNSSNNSNLTYPSLSNYGNGGTSTVNGNSGLQGAVQIIWLYD